jgi:hypothetical protein
MNNHGYDKLIRKYEEYKRDLPNILEDKILDETAAELQSKVRKRIFTKGLDANGNTISQSYSTKPTVVKKDVFIRPSAFKGNKTMRLEHGYKELRDIQGLQTKTVNLDYSGALKNSLIVERDQQSVIIGVNDRDNLDKVQKLEKKYQTKIFSFSEKEIQDFIKTVRKKLRKAQREYFYGR